MYDKIYSLCVMFVDVVNPIADVLTIIASSIAIYVFTAKRKELSTAIDLLLNWSFQTTLGDLKSKLERLNEYNANEPDDQPEIRNILHEISGQIRGNKVLSQRAPLLAEKLENLANSRRLTEPNKRSIVSETREILRNIEVNNTAQVNGADHV